ncbi:MAG: DUF1214 domain-containing protein [Pseudomonadota bacterium]
MKSALIWILAGCVGVILGGISALWVTGMLPSGPRLGATIDVEGWVSDWSIGSEAANPYVRARIARHGLLALRKEEAVYFTTARDDEGEPLREACVYRVEGSAFPAQWWSITLYDGDSRLPMNTDGKLSFDLTQANAVFGSDTAWLFDVRAEAVGDETMPWVSSRNAGQFDLMLRLYRPSADLLADPEAVLTPPRVTRLTCEEAAP